MLSEFFMRISSLPQAAWAWIENTHAFTFHGWAWAAIALAAFPLRHFYTRLAEGWALDWETGLIRAGKMDSFAVVSFSPRSIGGADTIKGSVVVSNLRTIGNIIMSAPEIRFGEQQVPIEWNEKFPLPVGARSAITLSFRNISTGIQLPQTCDLAISVEDAYDRKYAALGRFTRPH